MTEAQDSPNEDDGLQEMGILGHLEELRWCITRCLVVLLILFPFGVIFSHDLVDVVVQFSNVTTLIATEPTEIFMQQFRIGFMLALYLAIPYLLYQVWQFVSPGLYDKEKNWGRYAAFASYVLFLMGSLFGLLVIVPICLNFFSSLESEVVRYTPRLADMISFILRISAATGLASQLPVVVVLLYALGLVSIETLAKARPWVIITVFFMAAILTPPDITSQLMLGLPTCMIYELSLIVCRILNIGKGEEDTTRSKFIRGAAFTAMFVMVFGGAFGIYYTWNWYKQDRSTSVVDNISKYEQYQEKFAKDDGPEALSKTLESTRGATEKAMAYKALVENWKDPRLKNLHRQRMLQYAFQPELTIIREKDKEVRVDLKVSRKVNIPLKLEFYWALKINDREILWPDSDNNLRYTYSESKKEEEITISRGNALASFPVAREILKKDGSYKIQLILKTIIAEDMEKQAVSWAESVVSEVKNFAVGNVKKEEKK